MIAFGVVNYVAINNQHPRVSMLLYRYYLTSLDFYMDIILLRGHELYYTFFGLVVLYRHLLQIATVSKTA